MSIEKIYSQIEINILEARPPLEFIYNELASVLAHHITSNIDKLPVKIVKEEKADTYSLKEVYTMRVNLISDEQLKKFEEIERENYILKRESFRKPEQNKGV